MKSVYLSLTIALTAVLFSVTPQHASADSSIYIGGATFDFGDVRLTFGHPPVYTERIIVHRPYRKVIHTYPRHSYRYDHRHPHRYKHPYKHYRKQHR